MTGMMSAPRGRGGQIARVCETLGITVSGLRVLDNADHIEKEGRGLLEGGRAASKLEDDGYLKTVSHMTRRITPAGSALMARARELGY